MPFSYYLIILLQVENHVREKITQQLAEICSDALSCRVEDMATICDQILSDLEEESNVVIRKRRHNSMPRNVSILSYSIFISLFVSFFLIPTFNHGLSL
jgi:hypothetical protein